jgi:hypothetical protein
MRLDPRIPEPFQPAIKDYLRRTEQRPGGLIHSPYNVGSVSVGEV